MVLVGILVSAALLHYGVPWLAKGIAYHLPPQIDQQLGRDTLQLLDDWLLQPTQLAKEQQQLWQQRFASLVTPQDGIHCCQLEFRAGGEIGANALALPSGIIVVTDELIALAQHEHEITAVLAHEIGHIHQRHSLRALLQHSVVALVIISVTGDAFSLTNLSAALPAVLLEAKYSRDFEREADAHAVQYLRKQKIPLHHFANILRRLDQELDTRAAGYRYLSSHPETQERIGYLAEADLI